MAKIILEGVQPARPSVLGATIWTLSAELLPLFAAVVAFPILSTALGVERFGVLMVTWALITYFSLFDFGIGRALTKLVAERRALADESELFSLVRTGLISLFSIAVLSTPAVVFGASFLIDSLNIPPRLRPETTLAIQLLGLSIPVLLLTAGLKGVLEGHQKFRELALLRGPIGALSFVAPLLVIPFSKDISYVVAAMLFARAILFVAILYTSLPHLGLGFHAKFHAPSARRLFEFGGWMTVTNVVGPLMTNLDRVFLGMLLPVSAVAYYAVPYEVLGKLTLLAAAFSAALFPAFSALNKAAAIAEIGVKFWLAVKYLAMLLFPAILLLHLTSTEALSLWLGAEFAEKSIVVVKYLLVGIFVNSVAQIAFALVQGVGRPDITGKFHLLELVLYGAAFWPAVSHWGIEGAAFLWAGRCLFDAFALLIAAGKVSRIEWDPKVLGLLGACTFSLALVVVVPAPLMASYVLFIMLAFVVASWLLLSGQERTKLRGFIKFRMAV